MWNSKLFSLWKKHFLALWMRFSIKREYFVIKKQVSFAFWWIITYYEIKIFLKLCIKLCLNVKQFSFFSLHLKVANCWIVNNSYSVHWRKLTSYINIKVRFKSTKQEVLIMVLTILIKRYLPELSHPLPSTYDVVLFY